MADDKFKLPGASYDELVKIISAYANLNKDATPAEVANLAGKPREEVSRNNGFLVAIGIIEGSPKGRHITAGGHALARAIENNLHDEIAGIWRSLCESNEFVQKVLSAVRVRRGMDRSTLVGHVVYTAGQRKTPQATAGANCLVDILSLTSLLVEDNGKLNAAKATPPPDSKGEASSRWVMSTLGEEAEVAEQEPAITYTFDASRLPTFSTLSNVSRLPFEIRLNVSVQCSVEEIPSLAPKIRQLIRDLTTPPPADDVEPTE